MKLIEDVIKISQEAGKLILEVYFSENFDQILKHDNSPLTIADKLSHNLIVEMLSDLTPNIPILSEESTKITWQERSKWGEYWLVDPLDGTKEFINKNGEFTVNIALIKDKKPVVGVVYAPVLNTTWVGEINKPAIKITNGKREIIKVSKHKENEILNIVGSRSHQSPDFKRYIKNLEGKFSIVTMGSSIKLCLVAEGVAHIYPRLGLTSEWDTAAAHAVVNSAGGKVIDVNTNTEITYNKKSILNPFFVVLSK